MWLTTTETETVYPCDDWKLPRDQWGTELVCHELSWLPFDPSLGKYADSLIIQSFELYEFLDKEKPIEKWLSAYSKHHREDIGYLMLLCRTAFYATYCHLAERYSYPFKEFQEETWNVLEAAYSTSFVAFRDFNQTSDSDIPETQLFKFLVYEVLEIVPTSLDEDARYFLSRKIHETFAISKLKIIGKDEYVYVIVNTEKLGASIKFNYKANYQF